MDTLQGDTCTIAKNEIHAPYILKVYSYFMPSKGLNAPTQSIEEWDKRHLTRYLETKNSLKMDQN